METRSELVEKSRLLAQRLSFERMSYLNVSVAESADVNELPPQIDVVTALQPSEVAVVEAADFHKLIAAYPEVHLAFTRLVCYRLRQALSWIDDVMLMPLSARLARRLAILAPNPRDERTVLSVTQEDLAAMLGASRQSINRQLKQWEAKGTIALKYRAIEILRWDVLELHGNV